MNGDLELLLKLQDVDYDLGELERSKEYIPDMMDNLKREISDCEEKLFTLKEDLSKAQLEQKDVELQLSDRQDKLKKLQERMMAIKTNKEYDALISEIDQVKKDIWNLENRGVELIEITEEKKKELDGLDDKAEQIRQANTAQLTSLQEQIDSVGSKISEREQERQAIAKQVNPRAISVYERIRKGKGGAAVVAVKKRACGSCYKSLPPQKIQEIRIGDRIITCDSCGRMLIWTQDSDV